MARTLSVTQVPRFLMFFKSARKFRVLIEGENLLMDLEGMKCLGLYTTRYVKAANETEASHQAIRLVQEELSLTANLLNEPGYLPEFKVSEIEELATFRGICVPGKGFTFFPMVEDDGAEGPFCQAKAGEAECPRDPKASLNSSGNVELITFPAMRNPYLAAFFRFLVCVLIAAPFVIAYYLLTRPMAVRTALPWQAVIAMHEFYQDSAPLPDYMHCISVKVTESEFKSFVTQMELVPYRGRESFPSCETNWWKASDGSSGAFYNPRKKGENARAMAKFENGTLYYVDIDY